MIVKPGDTLIVVAGATISAEQADAIREQITRQLPELASVIVMQHGTQLAAFRPKAADK